MESLSFDEFNIDLSVRQYLFDLLYATYQIPIVGSVQRDDLDRPKMCYYYIVQREGRMGDPRVMTDLTYHIRAHHSATPYDRDGKWVREIGEYVRSSILKATEAQWDQGSFPILDFKAQIPQFDLDIYRETGDLDQIDQYLQHVPRPQLGAFWAYRWSESRVENLEYDGVDVFDYTRNVTLMHYAPDIIRY